MSEFTPFDPEPEKDPGETQNIPSAETTVVEEKPRPGKFGIFGSIQSIGIYAFLLASLFTLFTPNNLFSGQTLERMFQAWQANPTVAATYVEEANPITTPRIGIVSGHWKNDSGAVCSDGLTEKEVNLEIANRVKEILTQSGYKIDLLSEFDGKLKDYKGIVLLSIHSDTCDWISEDATGFKVAAAIQNPSPEKSSRLVACMANRYQAATGLKYLPNTVTNDMTYYHAFDEINPNTTAAIMEIGFLNLDRQILTQKPDVVAQGIANGLICFIQNESIEGSTQTP
jgi:N-acetylmuramoyl-L-alanine amidase